MRFTTLIENGPSSKFQYEHGLSFWIEFENQTFLLDAGMSHAFMDNAKQLQIDISHPDACILSHGHNDHGGGFCAYVKQYPNAKIYMKEEALLPHYSGSHGHIHDISINPVLKDHAIFIQDIQQIADNVYIVADDAVIPEPDSLLYTVQKEKLVQDNFNHELSLVFVTKKGLIIFNSCSHARFEGILPKIKKIFNLPIYAYIGGLHLKDTKLNEDQYKKFSTYIQKNIPYLYTGHCTGDEACQKLPVLPLEIGKPIEL